jgi:hypothetical protein
MNHPKASPLARIEQEVGLSKITVEYSRPAARGRVLFGNQPNGNRGLVPYDRIWRVGANESTKITFKTDVYMEDKLLPKGTYALYAFPEEEEWQIVFHGNTTHWGDGRTAYNATEDVLRIKVKPIETITFQENLLISFDEISHNGLTMIWNWGNTKVSIPIKVDTLELMEMQIQNKLANGPTGQTYYEIARYYQEQGIKQEESLKFVDIAIVMDGDTYYFQRVKSLILADMGHYNAAVKAAELSLKLANIQGKDEFVRLNENNIRNWKKLVVKNN